MSSSSHQTPARVRPAWLVVTVAALLAVPLLALPAGAAPPVTSITDVSVTGTPTATVTADGTGECLWRMEVTIENFRGGGKNFSATLGSPALSYLVTPKTYVKGKVTSFVWETTASLDYFPSVANWVVRADNNKGLQAFASLANANVECTGAT
jgi:hypothetical protein